MSMRWKTSPAGNGVWVIFWFHRNSGWRPKVLPPRSASGRKGVFATRAPHRPNPLGLSTLKLLRISGLNLHVQGVDLLDGTPVLDIKPYVPYTDAFPDAGSGWLETAQDPVQPWAVCFEPLAQAQLSFLARQLDYDLEARILATLRLGPQPHPYRRIKPFADELQLAVKDWRIDFGVANRIVTVRRLRSGYRQAQLKGVAEKAAPALHRAFTVHWTQSVSQDNSDDLARRVPARRPYPAFSLADTQLSKVRKNPLLTATATMSVATKRNATDRLLC